MGKRWRNWAANFGEMGLVVLFFGCTTLPDVQGGKRRVIVPESPSPEAVEKEDDSPSSAAYHATAPMVFARYGFAYTTFDEKIYVFGGFAAKPRGDGPNLSVDGEGAASVTDTIEAYDPVTDVWTLVGKLDGHKIFGGAAAAVGNKILIASGILESQSGSRERTETDEVFVWDPGSRRTVGQLKLSVPRWGVTLIPYEDGLLVVGGASGGPAESSVFSTWLPGVRPKFLAPAGGLNPIGVPGPSDGPNPTNRQAFNTVDFIKPLGGASFSVSAFASLPEGVAFSVGGRLGGEPLILGGRLPQGGPPGGALGGAPGVVPAVAPVSPAFTDWGPTHVRTTRLPQGELAWQSTSFSDTTEAPPVWAAAAAQISSDSMVIVGGASDRQIDGTNNGQIASAKPTAGAFLILRRTLRGEQEIRELPKLRRPTAMGGAAFLANRLYVFGGVSTLQDQAVILGETWVLGRLRRNSQPKVFAPPPNPGPQMPLAPDAPLATPDTSPPPLNPPLRGLRPPECRRPIDPIDSRPICPPPVCHPPAAPPRPLGAPPLRNCAPGEDPFGP